MNTRLVSVSIVLLAAVFAPGGSASSADRTSVVAQASRAVVVVDADAVQGSAFAFGHSGEFLTNAHVVRNLRRVVITDSRGRRARAEVVAIDDRTDVALLRSELIETQLPPAEDEVHPGDTVLAIGAAAGLPGTVTEGIVSAVGRRVNGVSMIQTDAALNHGDSGGALIDARGRVVGVTSARQPGAEGIAFAIPIATARDAVTLGPPSIWRKRRLRRGARSSASRTSSWLPC
jgi:S1-C subfamily serine protease